MNTFLKIRTLLFKVPDIRIPFSKVCKVLAMYAIHSDIAIIFYLNFYVLVCII